MPKRKTLNDSETNQSDTKRRGRKPKEVAPIINSTDKTAIESDNIIVHLPIKTEKPDSFNYTQTADIPQYEAVMNEPVAFNNTEEIQGSSLNSSETIIGKSMISEPMVGESMICESMISDINIQHVHDWGTTPIANFNDVLDKFKMVRQAELEAFQHRTQRRNVEKCLIQFDECNKSQTWPTMTSVCCWWDTHSFTGAPVALPVAYEDGILYVFGVFCSDECAAAYNFNDISGYGDKWERYSLLNMMRRRRFGSNVNRVKLASPRQVLKKFGGHLTIEEFRATNDNTLSTYKFIMPPMTSLIPFQEMTSMDKGYHTKTLEYKPSTDDTASYCTQISEGSSATEGLRLKRSKPLKASSNALERHMLVQPS